MKLPKDLRERTNFSGTENKKIKCSVNDCGELAIRSLSENQWSKYIEKANLKIDENKQHRIFLCKRHYKEVNKVRKSQEKLYQKKGFLDNTPVASKQKHFDFE